MYHGVDGLGDLWTSSSDVVEGELVEWASRLDVVESGFQILQFLCDLLLGLLSRFEGLGFECVDSLVDSSDVVGCWLEVLYLAFELIDNCAVLEGCTVVGEVDVYFLL